LLTRNLHDVFGENDPARRRAAIDEIFTEDCVFYDPKGGVYRGRDEIDRTAGAVKATHPDVRYQPLAQPEEAGNGGGSNGYRAAPVRRQHTLVLISLLPGTTGLPPFIFFRQAVIHRASRRCTCPGRVEGARRASQATLS
jgi:hypothetical protein